MASEPSLRQLIYAMRWEDARKRLLAYPDEASHLGRAEPLNWTTPGSFEPALATACRFKAPPSFIQALVTANPRAISHRLPGRTYPLHISCRDISSTSTSTTNLRQSRFSAPSLDDEVIIRILVRALPISASLVDDQGWLPLHCACTNATFSTLNELVSAYPRAVLKKNKGGVTPLEMLWDRKAINEEDGRCLLSPLAARSWVRVGSDDQIIANIDNREKDAVISGTDDPVHYSNFTTPQAYARRGIVAPSNNSAVVWCKVMLMVRAIYSCEEIRSKTQNVEGTVFRPLHALAGLDVNPSILRFGLLVHNVEQHDGAALPLERMDENGNLPLHVAVSVKGEGDEYFVPDNGTCIDGDLSNRAAVIQMLLKAYPTAARVPNNVGRLPLHVAIVSCTGWNVVRPLIESEPEVVAKRDPKTGLYPAMLAALVGSLDLCYGLLKYDPSVICGR